MDSGNSGSLQSSSGGDEEYDSRAESISSFLNPTTHVGLIPNPPPQPPHHHHHHTSTTPMFDPLLPNYFQPISRPPLNHSNPSSLLNLDMVWFKPQRSEINPIFASPSSSSVQPFFGSDQQTQSHTTTPPPPASSSDQIQIQIQTQTHVGRNPKKRPRASRRAPTTVLTTDTTNFRAMVQEFTGIPAPPFTSSLPFSRTTRFDLFGTPSTIRSNPILDNTSQPPYFLRPSAQKLVQPPPPFVSFSTTSMVDANNIASTTTNNMNITSNVINYQLLPSQSDLLNMQNQIHPFQSLFQFPPKYPPPNSANLGPKTQESLQIPSNDSHLKVGALDQFGFSHREHVNGSHLSGSGVRNLGQADGTASRINNDNPTNLRSVDGNGNYNYLRNVSNGKLNFSASSSDFRGDKGSENGATRGEGMVESWICSSD